MSNCHFCGADPQSTYDYGRQLLQATVVLCQSLRCTTRSSGDTLPRLNRVWKQFSVSAEERQQRLELAQNFHTAAEKVRPSHVVQRGKKVDLGEKKEGVPA